MQKKILSFRAAQRTVPLQPPLHVKYLIEQKVHFSSKIETSSVFIMANEQRTFNNFILMELFFK